MSRTHGTSERRTRPPAANARLRPPRIGRRELRRRRCGSRSFARVRPLAALRLRGARRQAARWRGAPTGGRGCDGLLAEVAVDEVVELVGAERLLLDEPGDVRVEQAPVVREQLVRAAPGAVHDLVDLAVDELGG